MTINSIDDFLKHRGSEFGGGTFLKSWKKAGKIDIWLHTKRLPLGLWQHRFPKKMVLEDKDTGEPRVEFWQQSYNCHENESVLRKQYRYTRDGDREVPPQACPLCKLLAYLRKEVEEGRMAKTEIVFAFKGATDPEKNITMRAGGLCKLYRKEEAELLKKHGVYLSDAWKENAMAGLQYLFCVVDNDNVDAGVQVAIEPQLVGDKVKTVINDKMADSDDPNLGNPMIRPYCIQLTKNKDERASFDKMYHARSLERIKLTPEVEKLIRSEAPDISGIVAPFDVNTLRAVMEHYAVTPLPWEQFFGGSKEQPSQARSPFPPSPSAVPAPPAASPANRTRKVAAKPQVECDSCKAMMDEDASKCPKCGTTYEFEEEEDSGVYGGVDTSGIEQMGKLPF